MLVRKDLFPALQKNFSTTGPLSLMVGAEVQDRVAFSTKVYQHYLGNSTIDQDHIEELTKVSNSVILHYLVRFLRILMRSL